MEITCLCLVLREHNQRGRRSRIHHITVRKYLDNIANLHTISQKQVTPKILTHRNSIIGTILLYKNAVNNTLPLL